MCAQGSFQVDPEAPEHVIDEQGTTVAIAANPLREDKEQSKAEQLANAVRIAAALNLCVGIPIATLVVRAAETRTPVTSGPDEHGFDSAQDDLRRDNPFFDGTDAAHAAWWRGNDRGVHGTAEALRRIAETGQHTGCFANRELEAAAQVILALHRTANPNLPTVWADAQVTMAESRPETCDCQCHNDVSTNKSYGGWFCRKCREMHECLTCCSILESGACPKCDLIH